VLAQGATCIVIIMQQQRDNYATENAKNHSIGLIMHVFMIDEIDHNSAQMQFRLWMYHIFMFHRA
jgi:hypothetical protein